MRKLLMNDQSVEGKIKWIEKELRETPHHKGTDHYIGKLRARLSKLKEGMLESQTRKGGGGGGYAVKKQGDATVVLVGPPSAGKSTLLNALTNAESKVAPYAFTTVSVIPGMMNYHDAYIQILDVPGLIEGAEEGKGRGREVLSVARGSDLLIIMSDVKRHKAIPRISEALERNGIRINKTPPEVKIDKKLKGGLSVKTNIKQPFDKEMVKEIASEMGVKNAEIQIREHLTLERLIDAFSRNRAYVAAIEVLNKSDTTSHPVGLSEQSSSFRAKPRNLRSLHDGRDDTLYISAEKGTGLQELKKTIWDKLNLVRVYLVRQDEQPSENNPMIIKVGDRLSDVAIKIGTDFTETHTKAKIWGSGAKFPGQEISLSTRVQEGMMVRFI